jgi:hypothetical protein
VTPMLHRIRKVLIIAVPLALALAAAAPRLYA